MAKSLLYEINQKENVRQTGRKRGRSLSLTDVECSVVADCTVYPDHVVSDDLK